MLEIASNPRVVLQDYPTTIGKWWVIYREGAGVKTCLGAFQVDVPDMRITLGNL